MNAKTAGESEKTLVNIGNDWDEILSGESHYVVYPDMYDIFNALKWTSYKDAKVVILGQDPYHEVGQAHGLAFSVQKGVAIPPSLLNIYKELHDELGLYIPNNGYLEKWARQGVLLLNSSLTVRSGAANSHRGKGWEIFTDRVVELLNDRADPVIFMLWGNNAKEKIKVITNPRHKILTANRILSEMNKEPIDWQIENI